MGFSFEATADDVPDGIDLSGQRFVTTGATSGVGEEATRSLAAHGASILMLARDPSNADAAARVRTSVPGADLSLGTVDLDDLDFERTDYDPWIAYGRSKPANALHALALSQRRGGVQFESIPQGAAAQVRAATSPELVDHVGAYLADCGLGVRGGDIDRNGFAPYIADTARAGRLWGGQ